MDIIGIITSSIVGAIISLIFSLLFTDFLRDLLATLVIRFARSSKKDISGQWRSVFTVKRSGTLLNVEEILEMKTGLGIVVARKCINDSKGINQGKDKNKPLRLRGELQDGRYLTGIWYHPSQISRFHGSFQLVLRQNGKHMSGIWTGFDENKNKVVSGEWVFERVAEQT